MKYMLFVCALSLSAIWQSASSQITWQKNPGNPVLRFWTGEVDDPNGYRWAIDPAPLVDQNGICHMWFTSCAYGYGTSFCVSEAVSTDLVRWFAYFKNPVLEPGPQGSFDQRGVRAMAVLRDSLEFKMYYQGFTAAGDQAIGLATSADGITWTKHNRNPVLDAGPPGTWEALKISTASVYFDGNGYSMWYTGWNGTQGAIGLATSPDGVDWTRYAGNPILVAGPPGSWEEGYAEGAKIVKVGNTFHMFYAGHDPALDAFHIGYAFSSDGIHWTKYAGNPVLSRGGPAEWDGQSLGLAGVIFQDNRFHLWYNGLGVSSVYPPYWQIGYAVSDYTPLTVISQAPLPADFRLLQNYPNPFNPSTTIGYGLPERSEVQLTVFSTLGQQVAVLVQREVEAGYHEVKFDATGLSSGVYFYKLQAGDFVQTRKLLLLR